MVTQCQSLDPALIAEHLQATPHDAHDAKPYGTDNTRNPTDHTTKVITKDERNKSETPLLPAGYVAKASD